MAARHRVLLAALALTACTGNSSGLTGASSMRVEVEVYKGPLSNDVPIQIGELRTVVEETARTLLAWYKISDPQRIGLFATCRRFDCAALEEAQQATQETLVEICNLRNYVIGAVGSPNKLNCVPPAVYQGFENFQQTDDVLLSLDDAQFRSFRKHQDEIAQRLSLLAGDMKAKGFRVADHLITYVPREQNVRAVLANFNLIMSEYSNQI